jgi:hypothetical protein
VICSIRFPVSQISNDRREALHLLVGRQFRRNSQRIEQFLVCHRQTLPFIPPARSNFDARPMLID